MKILVCISRTPDTTAKIAFAQNNTKFVTEGVQWIINPYDEWYALVKALEIKEAHPDTQVHLITVGLSDTEATIRKALALGGDEAYRVDSDPMDSFATASQIAEAVKNSSYDLILTGKETIDYNGGSVGALLSELLDMAYVGQATALQVSDNRFQITREIEGGNEVLEASAPLVVACQKGMAEARIPNMRGIMAARTKPLHVLTPAELETRTSSVSFELPPAKTGAKMIPADQPELLVKLLREEAKLI